MNDLSFLCNVPIAHRGLHGNGIPENSLRAFEAAVAAGYAVETDVRLAKDGALVIFHDDTLLRMTGDGRKVIERTLKELGELRLDGTDAILSFPEFLTALNGRAPLLLEIKDVPETNAKEYVGKIAAALEGYVGEYAVQSFQPAYVKAFKKLRPDIPCGILATGSEKKSDFGGSPIWKLKAYAVRHMSLNFWIKPDFISYHFSDLPTRKTEKFRGPILAWTVRSEKEETRARLFADNIIFERYLPAFRNGRTVRAESDVRSGNFLFRK